MCKFTLITYLCEYEKLLTSPEYTLLCSSALHSNLRQGIDRAPASCFPLPEDIDDNERTVQKQWAFTACNECWVDSRYSANDTKAIEDVEARVIELCSLSNNALRTFESRVDLKAKISDLPHAWLRYQFAYMDSEKSAFSHRVFFSNLFEAGTWVPYLFACLQQNNPRDMFDTTFTFVKEKVDAADKELDIFIKIMEHMDLLDWDTHAWKNKLCNLAEDLQFLIESNQLNHFQDDASEEIETGLTSLSGDQSNHSQAKFIGTSKSVGASISMGERSNHFATPNMQGSNESVRVRDADTSAFDVHVEHTGCPSYALNEKQAHPVLFKRRDIEFGDVVQT